MTVDVNKYVALDIETPLFRPGYLAPKIICSSWARMEGGEVRGKLVVGVVDTLALFRWWLESDLVGVFANASYDLAVVAQADPTLLPLIKVALQSGRVHCILIAQALDAIYGGHLGKHPDGGDLRKPDGKVTNRYSLEIVTQLVLNRADAKANDIFRKSYALLEGVPVEEWPPEAAQYPIDDVCNTLECCFGQLLGAPAGHTWKDVAGAGLGADTLTVCNYCGDVWSAISRADICDKAPRQTHQNMDNLAFQVETSFTLYINSAHSLRTDEERVVALTVVVEEKRKVAVERFQKFGWIRPDGTEDQVTVKRSVAVAYGAVGDCKRCGGSGKVARYETKPCRGVKVSGRYKAGCQHMACTVCGGRELIEVRIPDGTCANSTDNQGNYVEGCGGTGLDLSTAEMLPRTAKDGIGTGRDALAESGDEELAAYGENEFEKSISTYLPYLRKGTKVPLYYSPNVILNTGRISYEGSVMHQMPRNGGERECIRARGAWCNYFIETAIGSTDYEAGELDTLAQLNYWLFNYSQMRDAINKSGKPGILHSDLAAEVLGISLEEFLVRHAAKDKTAGEFRQAMKPIQFGVPGGMGVPKLVMTNRKKNAGFTVCERGPARDSKGRPGYWGIRFCILTGGKKLCGLTSDGAGNKITQWKNYSCAPICKDCVLIVDGMLKPAYFRRYPEVRDYHKWVAKKIERGEPAPTVVWDAAEGKPRIVRERKEADFPAFANNGFQSMLAEIMKHAYNRATWECFLGVTVDGAPSPLAGSRIPLVMHDEPLSELILSTAHKSGPRIAELMMDSGHQMAPDVTWRAETAIAHYYSKSMEPVYVDGKLSIWTPA